MINSQIKDKEKEISDKLKVFEIIYKTKQKSPSFGVMLRSSLYDLFELSVQLDKLVQEKQNGM